MWYHVVLDTNVILSALRSRRGASFQLVERWALLQEFVVHLSLPLSLEYEEVVFRYSPELPHSEGYLRAYLAALATFAQATPIYFRWRPFLRDADDDMVLEAAIARGCQFIVTFNTRDFRGCESLGIQAITPGEFLSRLNQRADSTKQGISP